MMKIETDAQFRQHHFEPKNTLAETHNLDPVCKLFQLFFFFLKNIYQKEIVR